MKLLLGAKVRLSGLMLIVVDDSEGYFIHPTVIVSKDPKSKLMTEEIFGPVLTVYPMKCFSYFRFTFMKMVTGVKC
jgi:acyl-CoA reductase-like NAD-dependent aldehyde dehydrogenase